MTVYIPFYYGERHFDSALESALSQDTPGITVKVLYQKGTLPLDEMRSRYQRPGVVILDSSTASTIGGNWNFALDDVDTDLYFVILHQDDRLAPDYGRLMQEHLDLHPELSMVFCDVATIDAEGRAAVHRRDGVKRILRPAVMDRRHMWAAMLQTIPCPTVCFRRDALGNLRFSTELSNEVDTDCWGRALLAGRTIGHLKKTLYQYRRHGENESVKNAAESRTYLELRELARSFRGVTSHAWMLSIMSFMLFVVDLIDDIVKRKDYRAFRRRINGFFAA